MNVDQMTVGELKQLTALIGANKKTKTICDGGVRIVVLQRGWVVVGRFSQHGSECKISKGYVIRNWGTTNGLGEIAKNGPTSSTKLDESPDISYHELTSVLSIQCAEDKWSSKVGR